MKISNRWISVFLVFAGLCLVGWTSYGQKQKSSRTIWEYKMVYARATNQGENSLEILSSHGAEGWELVNFQIVQGAVTSGSSGTMFCFKRAK
jgi:hypothetical protein